jgi:hypothetical protein
MENWTIEKALKIRTSKIFKIIFCGSSLVQSLCAVIVASDKKQIGIDI